MVNIKSNHVDIRSIRRPAESLHFNMDVMQRNLDKLNNTALEHLHSKEGETSTRRRSRYDILNALAAVHELGHIGIRSGPLTT